MLEGAGRLDMTQPETGARERGQRESRWPAAGEGALVAGGQQQQDPAAQAPCCDPSGAAMPQRQTLPPGQYIPRKLPVLHYGPVPTFHHRTWDLRIFGSTESGDEARLRWDDVEAMPVREVTADFHCVTKFTVPGICWTGIAATELLRRFPPAAAVTHVMIWADFGYSANIRIADFVADDTLLATHRDGERLSPEHGFPVRLVVPHLYAWKSVKWVRAIEYLTADRRGFWEERGYHNTADPWREQRYSYQERDGEGPPL
jgi:DMSO/TMAO reductase YedYZ molybdopterin-dependent catalytic subunit